MNSKSPLFTIVMPTRNRAHILPHALRSALNQTFDNYEIVVMANHCQDNTRAVVESMATSRVHYYETEKTLSMPDNFEYAWTKARGKYVTYLSDDDALVPTALEFLALHLEGNPPVISWEDAIYHYPNQQDITDQQNLLLLTFFGTTEIEEVDSSILLDQLASLEFSWTSSTPKMNNCAVDRVFWEQWRQRLGRLFFPIAPDYSFAWIATQICPNIRIARRPLSVRGISGNSIGSDANLGSAGQAFFKEFDKVDFFSESPIMLPTSMNIIFATFMQINAALKQCGIIPKTVDRKNLIRALTKQLIEFHHLLPDAQDYFKLLMKSANGLSEEFEEEINTSISNDTTREKVQSALVTQQRTREAALAFLPSLKEEMLTNGNDLQSALYTLALRDDVLAAPDWSCLYVFGDAVGSKNIYDISTHVNHYYDLLVHHRNKSIHATQKHTRTLTTRSINYIIRKLYSTMNF